MEQQLSELKKLLLYAEPTDNLVTFQKMFGYDLIEKFQEETGIMVKLEPYPFRQLFQVIEVKLTAKDPNVDVLWVDSPLTASYAVRGYTKPVGEDLLSKEELKDFFPATIEIATWDGKLYNVPFQNSSQVMYINKDLFQKAGVEPPVMDVNPYSAKDFLRRGGRLPAPVTSMRN